MTTRQPGNPVNRRRGETVRAVLMSTIKPEQPMPLEAACALVGISRATLCEHLTTLIMAKRIRGYTTANGLVRVW
jgi:predicted ArsR family transcriptional regulator